MLNDVATIDGIQVDVTPSGGSTASHAYIVQNVEVLEQWRGEQWRTSDGVNHLVTQERHLIFRLSGEWVSQTLGTDRPFLLLDQDLKEPESYTVELYPDKDQGKKFEVIAYSPEQRTVAAFENGVRSDDDEIQCITKNKVSRADVEFFRKY